VRPPAMGKSQSGGQKQNWSNEGPWGKMTLWGKKRGQGGKPTNGEHQEFTCRKNNSGEKRKGGTGILKEPVDKKRNWGGGMWPHSKVSDGPTQNRAKVFL